MQNKNFLKIIILFIWFVILSLGVLLRFYKLTEIPSGLIQDEAVCAYDAYSLLKTGKDHHGAKWPITFQTFNDWTGHSFIYQLIPLIKIVGFSEFSIRFTVAFYSLLTIVLIYFLIKEVTANILVSLSGTLFYTLSWYSVTTSRWSIQPNTVAFFISLSLLMFFRSYHNKHNSTIPWIITGLISGVTLYSYPAVEFFLPMWYFFASMCLIYFRKKEAIREKNLLNIRLFMTILFIAFLPLIIDHLLNPQTFLIKFNMVSIKENNLNPLLTYIYNYFSYLLPTPLFFWRDVNPTRVIPAFGYENPVLGLFYYFGLFFLFFLEGYLKKTIPKLDQNKIILIRLFILLFPVIPALFTPSGNFQRTTYFIPILFLVTAIGFVMMYHTIKLVFKNRIINYIFWCLIFVSYIYQQINFFRIYFSPQYIGITQWYFQKGLDEVVDFTSKNEAQYKNIFIDSTINQPYIYILFYKKFDPKLLTMEDYRDFSRVNEETGWLEVKKFRSYRFETLTEEDIKNAKKIVSIYNSPYSNYDIYEKDRNLYVKFEVNK